MHVSYMQETAYYVLPFQESWANLPLMRSQSLPRDSCYLKSQKILFTKWTSSSMPYIQTQSFVWNLEWSLIPSTGNRNTVLFWSTALRLSGIDAWIMKHTSDPHSIRVHQDSTCCLPTVTKRGWLALARLQDEVSDVNEDRNVGMGRAVRHQEALDCLHLIQNS